MGAETKNQRLGGGGVWASYFQIAAITNATSRKYFPFLVLRFALRYRKTIHSKYSAVAGVISKSYSEVFVIKNKFILGVLSTLLSSGVSASDKVTDVTVTDVIVNLSTGVHFRTVEAIVNPGTCSNTTWYKLPSDSEYEKEAYSLLLTAQAQNKKVNIGLDGCTAGYPKVVWIY